MDSTMRGRQTVAGLVRRWGASLLGIALAWGAGGCVDDDATNEAFGGSAPGFGDGTDGEGTDVEQDGSTDGADVEQDGSTGGGGAETGTQPRPDGVDDGGDDSGDDDRPDDDPGPSSTPPGGTDGGDDGGAGTGDPSGGTLPPEPDPEPHCCYDILFENACNEVEGCSWQGGDDNYCGSDCDGLLQFQCNANPVCYWVGTEARICAPGDDTGPLDCSGATPGG